MELLCFLLRHQLGTSQPNQIKTNIQSGKGMNAGGYMVHSLNKSVLEPQLRAKACATNAWRKTQGGNNG